ncbi:MAG: hypothetical protein KFB96_14280 [Thiocapsa sp.]|uniref:hypothetical protein n=1 Tax=Thiocapsa sp. TaxID=2024551 RepID=UPI001BCFA951|nr:hypothetical protein [Thiocapsa sp.]QVL46913.1 MAG: hypothetical protein KFB96_14280 [Thiocapsa sp.]
MTSCESSIGLEQHHGAFAASVDRHLIAIVDVQRIVHAHGSGVDGGLGRQH